MNELEFGFEHEGKTVYPGQLMHIHPEYQYHAGAIAKVERYYGDSVMLRTVNGAVPTVPIWAISWHKHPKSEARLGLLRAGFSQPTHRDVEVWISAQKAGKNKS